MRDTTSTACTGAIAEHSVIPVCLSTTKGGPIACVYQAYSVAKVVANFRTRQLNETEQQNIYWTEPPGLFAFRANSQS